MLGICSRGIKYWTWCHQFLTARAAPEVISLATKRLSFSIWVYILRRKWSVCEEMKHLSNDIVICYHLTTECRASIRRSAAVLSPLSIISPLSLGPQPLLRHPMSWRKVDIGSADIWTLVMEAVILTNDMQRNIDWVKQKRLARFKLVRNN